MVPQAVVAADDTVRTAAPEIAVAPRPATDYDVVLVVAVLALVALGTVEIYSASAVYAAQKMGRATYWLEKQIVYVAIGLSAFWVGARLDYRHYRRFTYPMLLGALLLLAAVLVVGSKVGGARRWFHAGPLSFQPVELAKFALVVYLAYSLAKKREQVRTFTVGFMPHLAVCGLMMALLLKQPDLGSSIILGSTTLTLLFIAGTKISYLSVAVLGAAPLVYHAIVGTPWRLRRLMAYLDPWAFRENYGYQITESLISIGSGGWTGEGLGQGKQKLFYLPEGHTDFILSNIGEELGFIGFALVLALFVVILWRGVKAALGSRDAFGTFLAAGLTTIFAYQALVNAGVVLGALPAKGLTLPFVSYGGTSLIVSLFFAGVILNVGRGGTPNPTPAARMVGHTNRRKRRRARIFVT
jgi:cell division protein FtsW